MDMFAEQLVQKQETSQDTLKRTCVIVITAVIIIISLILMVMGLGIAIILPVCVIWGAWYILKMLNIEYEYSCTNGVLDIDKIMGQSKRKQLLSIEVKNFTAYGKAEAYAEQSADDLTTFSVTGYSVTEEETEEYYAEFDHSEYGKCCIYFNPDEHFREVLEPYLSRELKAKLNKE